MKFHFRQRIDHFWNGFTEKQKKQVLVSLFVVFGAGALILGFMQINYRLDNPFFIITQSDSNAPIVLSTDEAEAKALAESKTKDTDADGLMDYDEQYTYKTSIYMADTDADGYSDKQEIDSGYNALCPSGKDCTGVGAVDNQSGVLSQPETMKKALLQYGFTESQLSQMSNDEIKKQYMFYSTQAPTATPTTEAQALRQAILQAGIVTEDQLKTLTDEEIMQIYNESASQKK